MFLPLHLIRYLSSLLGFGNFGSRSALTLRPSTSNSVGLVHVSNGQMGGRCFGEPDSHHVEMFTTRLRRRRRRGDAILLTHNSLVCHSSAPAAASFSPRRAQSEPRAQNMEDEEEEEGATFGNTPKRRHHDSALPRISFSLSFWMCTLCAVLFSFPKTKGRAFEPAARPPSLPRWTRGRILNECQS